MEEAGVAAVELVEELEGAEEMLDVEIHPLAMEGGGVTPPLLLGGERLLAGATMLYLIERECMIWKQNLD